MTSPHSHFITNNQLFIFLGEPIPLQSFGPPCIQWSAVHSDTDSHFAASSVKNIADAYHHIAVDHANTYHPGHTEPPPPYDIALWDPGYSSSDSSSPPDLVSEGAFHEHKKLLE